MDFFLALGHLANFVLPAVVLPLLLLPLARLLLGAAADAPRWWVQWLVLAGVGSAVLGAGLVWFGRDGKMPTYAALAVVVASTQWVLGRRWR